MHEDTPKHEDTQTYCNPTPIINQSTEMFHYSFVPLLLPKRALMHRATWLIESKKVILTVIPNMFDSLFSLVLSQPPGEDLQKQTTATQVFPSRVTYVQLTTRNIENHQSFATAINLIQRAMFTHLPRTLMLTSSTQKNSRTRHSRCPCTAETCMC